MPADISQSIKDWSATPASNAPAGSTLIGANLDDNLRAIQAALRAELATAVTMASAPTTDIGANDAGALDITGAATITSFGTVSAGIRKRLQFSGAATLTHNATSLILPNGGNNITTAAGDCAEFVSLGSGNWRCTDYQRANGNNVSNAASFPDGTASAPGIAFTADSNTGLYRIAADSIGVSTNGALRTTFTDTLTTIATGLTVNGSQAINLTPASASSPFAINLTAGASTTGAGADVNLTGGTSVSLSTGGAVNIKPGPAGAANRTGYINLWTGNVSSVCWRLNGGQAHMVVVDASGTPTISSGGGAGVAIVGTDNAAKITIGTAPGSTAIVVTFAAAFTNAPMCFAQYQGSHIALRCTATTGSVTITPASAMSAGDVIDLFCIGREAV